MRGVAFERDRLKVARLQAGGLVVMPITGRQIRRDPAGVVERLTAALDAARRGRRRGVS
jgi:very-short-patch-repair endonuclease